jgi:hypothetical protein
MNFNYKELLPADFAADSRVWVYQASRMFSVSEALQIEGLLKEFAQNWKSHGTPVKGYANLLFGQFIILMADESATGVSGCSTDSSVRLVKQIELLFRVNLFDRLSLAFIIKGKVQLLPLSQLDYAAENNFISAETIYFNNTVQIKKELEESWMIPAGKSWLARKLVQKAGK